MVGRRAKMVEQGNKKKAKRKCEEEWIQANEGRKVNARKEAVSVQGERRQNGMMRVCCVLFKSTFTSTLM